MHLKEKLNSIKNLNYIIFDFDGTIIDSERIWFESWDIVEDKFDIVLDEDYKRSIAGMKPISVLNKLKEKFDDSKISIVREIRRNYFFKKVKENKILPKAYAIELLELLKEKNITCYLASNSGKDYIHRVLKFNEMDGYFKEVVSREDVKEGKPSPIMYNYLIEKYGLKKDEGFILEDSESGIIAAIATNYHTVFIEDVSLLDKELQDKVLFEIKSLKELISLIDT